MVPFLIPFEITKFLRYSPVSIGLFSKTFTLGGAKTCCSIPENHNPSVPYLK